MVEIKLVEGPRTKPFGLQDVAPEVLEIFLNSAVKGPGWERRQQELKNEPVDSMKKAWLARQAKDQERLRLKRLRALPLLTQHLGNLVEGPGTREEGITLAKLSHLQPGAFFQSRGFNSKNLATYIGASNALLSMGNDRQAHWAMGGWQLGKKVKGEDAYAEKLNTLRVWLDKERFTGPDIRKVLQARKNIAEVRGDLGAAQAAQDLWIAAVAAHGVGDLDLGGRDPLTHAPTWAEFQGLALPMRIFTAEQVGLAFPLHSQRVIDEAVHAWGKQGYLRVQEEIAGLTIWRVTEKAVRAGVEAGFMAEEEGRGRLIVRRRQEAHDLAVGDALILLAVQAVETGIPILGVETETGIKMTQTSGLLPDFRLRLDMGPARVHQVVDVEVVGRGADYRGTRKLNAVKEAGMKVFSAGLDGCGVRHG